MTPRPFMELSNSKMLILEACPWRFQQQHIRGAADRPGDMAKFGLGCHEFFARYRQHLIRRRRRSDWEGAARIATETFAELIEQGRFDPQMLEDAMSVVHCFAGEYKLNRKGKTYVEQVLAVDRDWNPITVEYDHAKHGVPGPLTQDIITGIPDEAFVGDHGKRGHVRDDKSGMEFPTKEKVKAHPQLRLYAALVFAHNPTLEYLDLVLSGVRFGRKNIADDRIYREPALEAAKARTDYCFSLLDSLHLVFGDNDWPAKGQHMQVCTYCPVRERCPRLKLAMPGLRRTAYLPPIRAAKGEAA